MNLTEALNVALPDLPVKRLKQNPKFNPNLLAREVLEEGVPTMMVIGPETRELYRFTPEQWQLVQLFDGARSCAQVAQAFQSQTGMEVPEADVRDFAANLEEIGFWYKSPQERNAALMEKLVNERKKVLKKKSKYGDVSHMMFAAWDPDKFFAKVHEKLWWVYTWQFTLAMLVLFSFMVYVFVDRWAEIGRDTLKYYTFTEKNATDLLEFWLLFLGLAFFHESAHGLTCKHWGAGVHRMGFHLIYLTPAFFVDLTEVWLYANRWQRLITILAGITVELIFCGLATVVWWATPPGTYIHEFAYKVMLITGVAVVIVNLNPLIKLDGYYAFCEIINIADIKEKSTAFVSTWVRRHIFGLPVEVEYVPMRRRWFYVPYALLSGLYSYGLLYTVARIAGNIFRHYSPEWAFVPTLGLALLIFKSRIRNLLRLMKTLYLDKKERIRAWLTPPRLAAVAAVTAFLLFAPLWRETVQGAFLLEPVQRAVVRTAVPGTVQQVFVKEGDRVAVGAALANLSNLDLESEAAQTQADAQVATARATNAQLRYTAFGEAERQRQQLAERSRLLRDQLDRLNVTSPIAGVVVTPRVQDLTGSYLKAGDQVAEICDLSSLRATLFVPEFEVRKVRVGAQVSMYINSLFGPRLGTVASIAPASSEIEPGLIHQQEYRGMHAPHYYVAQVVVPNPGGTLRDGMSGTAKIFVRRRSAMGFVWSLAYEAVARKLW